MKMLLSDGVRLSTDLHADLEEGVRFFVVHLTEPDPDGKLLVAYLTAAEARELRDELTQRLNWLEGDE